MPFEEGNQLGKKAKVFDAALKRAIAQDEGAKVREAADQLLAKAASGEPWAIQLLADRLDGKATQQVELDATVHDGEVSDKPPSAEEWEKKHGGLGTTAGSATRPN